MIKESLKTTETPISRSQLLDRYKYKRTRIVLHYFQSFFGLYPRSSNNSLSHKYKKNDNYEFEKRLILFFPLRKFY